MSITRTEALTLLGAGTQPGPLAFARLINELFDRIEALEATDTAILAGIGRVFSPHRLYQSGDILLWYDPSDLTTMFQDTAGTTPVTADGDSVALMLDKGQWGGKTFAEVMAAQPELVTNGSFATDTSGWALRAATGGAISWSSGALRFERSPSGLSTAASQLITGLVVGRLYRLAGRARVVSGGGIAFFQFRTSDGGGGSTLGATANTASSSFAQLTGYWLATQTSAYVSIGSDTPSAIIEGDDISVKEVPGYHRVQATGTSMPKYKTDGTLHWLLYDGTDDGHATDTITWGTDEVAVCAGITKSSDATGMFVEFSDSTNSNNGSFSLYNLTTDNKVYVNSRGTIVTSAGSTANSAPYTAVFTGIGDISSDNNTIREDGAQVTQNSGYQGTGNFGSYPLYFGRRGGTSLPFNGREYQTVIRSRLLSAAELSSLETFVAEKTGVIL